LESYNTNKSIVRMNNCVKAFQSSIIQYFPQYNIL
jgi:hypothetical protein